ncbi:MAG: flagellar basal body P-ring formation chaperone FlgA [Rhizomicrobium sp.]
MHRFLLLACALLLAWPAFAETGVRIVVPAHDIARGTVITSSDLAYQTVGDNIMSGTVTSFSDLVGLETRRVLHMGESVRLEDVRHPIVVTKGSTVTMTFEAPGITLTAVGRALSEGGIGDMVTVQNATSFRQVSTVVIGPGQVRAQGSGATVSPRLASIQP